MTFFLGTYFFSASYPEVLAFLRARGCTVLNLIELRKPYASEKLRTKIRMGDQVFDYGGTTDILIKPMETEDEIRGKAFVHWKSWQESYRGIVDPGSVFASLMVKKIADELG